MRRNCVLDYTEALYYDDNQSNKGKILTQKEIEQGDFHRLDEFIKNYFIPINIRYKSVDGTYTNEDKYIQLSNIVKYNFCREEIEYIIAYLKHHNIAVVSREKSKQTAVEKDDFLYQKMAFKLPALEEKDQIKLLDEYQKTGSIEIRNKLFLGNMRIIYIVLKYFLKQYKLNANQISLKEYEEIGFDALIKAISKYKSNLGCKFFTYAFKGINDAYYHHYLKSRKKQNIFEIFMEIKLIVEEKLGINLVDDFTILDDILAYMQEMQIFSERDYDNVKAIIINIIKQANKLDFYKKYETFERDSINQIDYDLLISKLKTTLYSKRLAFDRDLNNLILNLGLDGLEVVSGTVLAEKSNIKRSAVNNGIRKIEKEVETSPKIAQIFDPILLAEAKNNRKK